MDWRRGPYRQWRMVYAKWKEEKLSRFLMKYRITPHSISGISPSQLLMGRRLRTRLDLLHPDLANSVENCQWKQKQGHDNSKPDRTFKEGDQVYAEDFSASSEKWLPGVVKKVMGLVSYRIQLSDGREIYEKYNNDATWTVWGPDLSEQSLKLLQGQTPVKAGNTTFPQGSQLLVNAKQPPLPAGNTHEGPPAPTVTDTSTTRPPDTQRWNVINNHLITSTLSTIKLKREKCDNNLRHCVIVITIIHSWLLPVCIIFLCGLVSALWFVLVALSCDVEFVPVVA